METKTANPAPLGLFGFGLTTFVLSWANAGLFGDVKTTNVDVLVVLGLAIFYGGIAQLLAGMWEFRAGNTFGATAFTSYGAFWLSFAALFLPGLGAGGAGGNKAIGIYLVGWAVITGMLMLGSFRINVGLAVVFILLFITYILLAIGALTPNVTISGYGGYVGIATAIVAWYVGLSGVLTSVMGGKTILPVFPLTR